MRVYLASPNSQQQAQAASDMPALLSFAGYKPWMDQYAPSFSHVLIDSGAYSELNSGKKIDVGAYREWSQGWVPYADGVAGLDNIGGDWERSVRNYEAIPWTFPTYHDSDPPELLDDLIPMARERGGWIGLGLVPPREGKEVWVRETCRRIPEDLHVHGWALRRYTHVRRLDSVDSTNWWRDAMKIRTIPDLGHLTYGECLEIVVKRYQRWTREIRDPQEVHSLFSLMEEEDQ